MIMTMTVLTIAATVIDNVPTVLRRYSQGSMPISRLEGLELEAKAQSHKREA